MFIDISDSVRHTCGTGLGPREWAFATRAAPRVAITEPRPECTRPGVRPAVSALGTPLGSASALHERVLGPVLPADGEGGRGEVLPPQQLPILLKRASFPPNQANPRPCLPRSSCRCWGVRGRLLVNGAPRDTRAFQRQSVYIQQDAALHPQLTVKEAMNVAAVLKLGRRGPEVQKTVSERSQEQPVSRPRRGGR